MVGQLEDVPAGGLELADGLFLAALPVSGEAGVLQRLWQDWLAARPVEVAQGGTVTQQPLSVTPDRVAPAVGALTFGPAVVEHLSFAGILDRIAEEHNLSWALHRVAPLVLGSRRDAPPHAGGRRAGAAGRGHADDPRRHQPGAERVDLSFCDLSKSVILWFIPCADSLMVSLIPSWALWLSVLRSLIIP